MNQQAMVNFFKLAFHLDVDRWTVSREIKRRGWSRHKSQYIAKERDDDLGDDFLERRSRYPIDTIIIVDESGSDRGIGMPSEIYGPQGTRPLRKERFHRGKRIQILPAYTIDGILWKTRTRKYLKGLLKGCSHIVEAFRSRYL